MNSIVSNLALYRKYRSQTFADLIGQEHVVKTLQSAIRQNKISHAYLFTGPRGTGKTSTARLLAKALNCENGPAAEPCNECEACVSITNGNCLDVIEMDAASESKVEMVRTSVVEASEYMPSSCRYRVFIIDEVHDLSPKAFDALLKTIEEPPAHVVFILATTEFNKVPTTVRSRCQRFEFHRGTIPEVAGRLEYVAKAEGIEYEPSALVAIARMSDGGFRDALTLLEQAILTSDEKVTLQQVYDQLGLIADESTDKLLAAMKARNVKEIIVELEQIYRLGRDPRSILESLLMRLADLTRALYGVEVGASIDSSAEASLASTSADLGEAAILKYRSELSQAHRFARDVTLPRLWLESELIRISSQGQEPAAPAKQQPVEGPAEKAKPSEPEPKKATSDQPKVPPAPPVESANGQSDEMVLVASAWATTVEGLMGQYRSAGNRLSKSKIIKVNGNVATVGFDRKVDADFFDRKLDAQKKVLEFWRETPAAKYELKFVSRAKPSGRSTEVEQATVELPVTGERLREMGHEVLGQAKKPDEQQD
ncbi:MAG: DNA polymerase III subunit gamma/tau [Armatimonadetes bacterium]|nr:DNA polymerase III subunit gamma/tau [Armatimonadota bacterium]